MSRVTEIAKRSSDYLTKEAIPTGATPAWCVVLFTCHCRCVWTHECLGVVQMGKTALHIAAIPGDPEIVQRLLARGALVETEDDVSCLQFGRVVRCLVAASCARRPYQLHSAAVDVRARRMGKRHFMMPCS